ncbi:MAG: hypothetical protein ACR2QK_16920 [Acidimicrobiales bacterium]
MPVPKVGHNRVAPRALALVAALVLASFSLSTVPAESPVLAGSMVSAGSTVVTGSNIVGDRHELCPVFAPSDVAANDRFGSSIGVDGDVAAIGAWLADPQGVADAGAVYVYEYGPNRGWNETAKLTAPVPETGAGFGFSVDVDGDILAVGAHGEAATIDGGPVTGAGAVHVFERQGDGSWIGTGRLALDRPGVDDMFGHSLEVDAATATIVAGAPGSDVTRPGAEDGPLVEDGGSAQVFVRDGTGTWVRQAELVDPDAQVNDRAGNDVAISGDRVVVGQHLDDRAGGRNVSNAGGALVYRRTGSTWSEPVELSGSAARARDRAGISVGIDGDVAAMAGWSQNAGERAVAWVFEHDGDRWVEQQRIEPGDDGAGGPTSGTHFGRHIELSDGVLAIGASLDDRFAPDGGAVHYYTGSDGFWLERAKIGADGSGPEALAGIALAVSDRWIAVGAERAALGAPNSGAACLARRTDVLDGSRAPDRRLTATAPVKGLASSSGFFDRSPIVGAVAAVVAILALVALGAWSARLIGQRRRRRAGIDL